MKPAATALCAIASVLGGCQLCNLALEYIVADPYGRSFGVGLTFLQFVTVAVLAFFLNVTRQAPSADHPTPLRLLGWRMQDRQLPLRGVLLMAGLFWAISTLNNSVFHAGVSMPVHTVFRSSSLVANMATGSLVFGRRHTAGQVACALAVTGGVVALSLAVAEEKLSPDEASRAAATVDGSGSSSELFWWALGMGGLLVTTVASTGLGLLQEHTYRAAKQRLSRILDARLKDAPAGGEEEVSLREAHDCTTKGFWHEALFYTHLAPLPLFVATQPHILGTVAGLPGRLLPAVAVHCVAQFLCIAGVYVLVSCTSAFTATFVVTTRKLATLLLSVVVFRHALTPVQAAAMCVAMAGAAAFPFLPRHQGTS